jgi:hypothetical protein
LPAASGAAIARTTQTTAVAAIDLQRAESRRRRQRLEDRPPEPFGDVIAAVIDFADPAIIGSASRSWDPATQKWR